MKKIAFLVVVCFLFVFSTASFAGNAKVQETTSSGTMGSVDAMVIVATTIEVVKAVDSIENPIGRTAAGGAAGAAAGAAAGSVVPIVGTVAGAVVGGLTGAIIAWWTGE